MKDCKSCGTPFKPTREWQQYCSKVCQDNRPSKADYTKQFQAKRRDLINQIKLDAGCSKCGYRGNPAALDFNHVRGEKLFNVSQDPKRKWDDILAEIAKCEVLCANCHRVHTYEEQHWQTKRTDR